VKRRIKRLSDRLAGFSPSVDQLARANPEAWDPALRWWRAAIPHGVGATPLDTGGWLTTVLTAAGAERRRYEEELRAHVDRDAARDIRAAKRALRAAAPLMDLLKRELAADPVGPDDLFFGDLGERVERAVHDYIGHVDARRPKVPAHRPADPWLRKAVVRLAHPLLANGQSRRRSIAQTHSVLVLAGHGDVATFDKVRWIVRDAPKHSPSFGKAPRRPTAGRPAAQRARTPAPLLTPLGHQTAPPGRKGPLPGSRVAPLSPS
jgi:hypothetical protein